MFPHKTAQLDQFCELDADYIVYGHTHAQLLKRSNGSLLINPGSAGHGRDPSNGRLLSCCRLDTCTDEAIIYNYADPQLTEWAF